MNLLKRLNDLIGKPYASKLNAILDDCCPALEVRTVVTCGEVEGDYNITTYAKSTVPIVNMSGIVTYGVTSETIGQIPGALFFMFINNLPAGVEQVIFQQTITTGPGPSGQTFKAILNLTNGMKSNIFDVAYPVCTY